MSVVSTAHDAELARSGQPPGEGSRQREALYQLVDRLHRAGSLQDIYTAAIDAILLSLGCDRASILIVDDGGHTRFVQSRGLSERYRRAVEGHSPWPSGERNPQPICLPDIDEADLDEPLRRVIRSEGIRALCFVPLIVDDRLIGKFMAYYDRPHDFDDRELDLGMVIGRQLAFGIARRRSEDRLRENEERLRRELHERKRAEQALRDSEHRLRLALAAGRMGTWEWNIATNAVTWSHGLEAIHGLEPGTFGGTFEAYQQDMHPDDRDRVLTSIAAAVGQGKEHHLEYRIVLPDGTIRWIEARGRLFRNEDGIGPRMIGVCTDITERKRNEEHILALGDDLRKRVEELNALLDVLPVGVLVAHDPACEHMTMNPAAARLLNLAPGENPSKSRTDAESLPFRIYRDGIEVAADDLPIQRAALSGRAVPGEVLDVHHADGTMWSEYICAVPLFDQAGRVRGALGAMVDITDRRRAEEALMAADRRKDEFLATLAHELRNPLAPIRNAIQLLMMKKAEDPDLRGAQEVIDRQVRHMTRLLEDLLDVSRISHNKLELRRERVELAALMQSAIETVRPLVDGAGHTLNVVLPAKPVHLDADPVRLAQVFSNLIGNAAKYTRPGGHIEVRAGTEGGEVAVSVKDNGIGIAPAVLDSIFAMFSRAEGALDSGQGGLGVGLSLARGLVELHGGVIAARSDGPGRGAEFIVRLPVATAREDAPSRRADEDRPTLAGQRRRLLVVDDLRDNADSLAVLLEVLGHEVKAVYGGEAALAEAEAFRPEVVLLDIGMPKVDGYEVCRRLRAQSWGRDTVLIALTGWGQEDDRRRSREAGFDHHLVKPVDLSTLSRVMATL